MNVQFFGEPRWRSAGNSICFIDEERFLSLDDANGVQEFSLTTGTSKSVWQSDHESLNVLLPTGVNRYFVGGSYGIGYDLVVTTDGEWSLQSKRELLDYFDCAAFAVEERMLAVCWYDLIRLVPLELDDSRQPVEVHLNKRRVFSIEWLPSQERFLVVSPDGLFRLALNGKLTQLKTPVGTLLAATSIPDTNRLLYATGKDRTTTLSCAEFDDPDALIWSHQFIQRTRDHSGYNKSLITSNSRLAYGPMHKEVVFACSASLRRFTADGVLLNEVQLPYSNPRLQLSPNENYAIIGNGIRQLMVFNRQGKQHLPRSSQRNYVSKLLFSRDERRVYSLAGGCPEVHCWDVEAGVRQWEFWSPLDAATDLLNEHEGRVLLCREGSTVDGAVMSVLDPKGVEKQLFPLNGFDARAVWFDSDRIAVVRKSFGNPLECQLRSYPSGRTESITRLGEHKPRYVAVGGNHIVIHDQYHIWIVDIRIPGSKYELEPPTEDVDLGVFADDESSVTVISKTGVFRSAVSYGHWQKLISFEIPITAAGSVVNGKIPIAFKGGAIEVRDIRDWSIEKQIKQPLGDAWITACALSKSEKHVVVGDYDGRVALCTFDRE